MLLHARVHVLHMNVEHTALVDINYLYHLPNSTAAPRLHFSSLYFFSLTIYLFIIFLSLEAERP